MNNNIVIEEPDHLTSKIDRLSNAFKRLHDSSLEIEREVMSSDGLAMRQLEMCSTTSHNTELQHM